MYDLCTKGIGNVELAMNQVDSEQLEYLENNLLIVQPDADLRQLRIIVHFNEKSKMKRRP